MTLELPGQQSSSTLDQKLGHSLAPGFVVLDCWFSCGRNHIWFIRNRVCVGGGGWWVVVMVLYLSAG